MSSVLKNTLLIFCSTIIAFYIANATLNYIKDSSRPGKVIPSKVTEFDPTIGYVTAPGTKAYSSYTGEKLLYSIDEKGSRSSIHLKNGKDQCAISVFGDSRTFGYGVDQEKVWTSVLNQNLPHLKVFNYGVPGYGLDQYYIRYLNLNNNDHSKLVLVYLPYIDDARHMYKYMFGVAKAFFAWDPETRKLKLETEHVTDDLHELKEALELSDVGQMVKQVYRTEEIKRQEQLRRKEKFTEEMVELKAIDIVQSFRDKVEQNNGVFVLFTEIEGFCAKLSIKNCHHFQFGDKYHIYTKKNENILHINNEGNQKLAQIVKSFIEENSLLPEQCFNSF